MQCSLIVSNGTPCAHCVCAVLLFCAAQVRGLFLEEYAILFHGLYCLKTLKEENILFISELGQYIIRMFCFLRNQTS